MIEDKKIHENLFNRLQLKITKDVKWTAENIGPP